MLLKRLSPLLGLALLAGCATGVVSIKMPISGGDTVPLELGKGGFAHAADDDVEILKAYVQLDGKTKSATYIMGLHVKTGKTPTSVKAEDVTEDTAQTLVEDNHPTLDKSNNWDWKGEPFPINGNTLKWLFEIENTVRVYRFTIQTADGRTLTLYQGFSYPATLKAYVRQQLGMEDAKGAPAPEPAAPVAPVNGAADQQVGGLDKPSGR